MRTPFELMHAFETGSGTAPGAIWVVPGRQLGVQDGQHGVLNGQLGGQDGPTWLSEAVPSAFPRDTGATWNDPERPKAAETDFSSISGRFWSIFRRFFFTLRSISARFWLRFFLNFPCDLHMFFSGFSLVCVQAFRRFPSSSASRPLRASSVSHPAVTLCRHTTHLVYIYIYIYILGGGCVCRV